MDIVFGLWADGGAYPDHGADGHGALGAPVVGPSGLIDILETRYGMNAPPAAYVVRIAAWQGALASADDGNRFWSASLRVDPWSTARTILGWRDQLVQAGWRSEGAWSERRLNDLAAAERAASALPAGLADRLRALNAGLDPVARTAIRRIRLIDRRADHPVGWRRLLDKLADAGVKIEELSCAPAAAPASALGQLQRWMIGGVGLSGAPDGTVTHATCASSALASEIAGQWLGTVAEDRSLVLIAQTGDTQLLDHGLAGSGQPRAGRSSRSPYRGSLQVLLLAFKITWRPFDAHALMELLLFQRSPVAARAAWRLAAALEEAPGRGGEPWLAAWKAIEAQELDSATDEKQRAKAAARLARWRSWVEPIENDPDAGMPATEVVAICDRVISWAITRHAGDADPLYLTTARLAGDVRNALIALERTHYPRTLVERIIDQALDEGHDNPGAFPEAAHWRSIVHPGAVWAPVDLLLWWDFADAGETPPRLPWTGAERAQLADAGCVLDEPERGARALSAAWNRALLNARQHVLLLSAGLDAHADHAMHPLGHRIGPAFDHLIDSVRLEDALAREHITLGGVVLNRAAVPISSLPTATTSWTTPEGYASRLADSSESATSFENLLSCQLMWALRHVARLRPGRARSIPDQNRLMGNLAHALAREIFRPGPPPPADAAAKNTEKILDGLIDMLAAPLRHPTLAADLAFVRRRLPQAMAELANTLHANALTVEAAERQVSGTFEDALAVRGTIDLVARDVAGMPVIIDLKWTRSPRSRLDELKQGKAVQLATYGALLAGETPYRAGYFLLNQRQFATLASSGLIGRTVDGPRTFPETWSAIISTWRTWRDAASAGTLLATGVEGAADRFPANLGLNREVRCDWCDYATLCRVRGLQ